MPDDRPDPPPHWWLKRGLLATAGLLVALLALRLAAGWVVGRRLAAANAADHAAGRPVVPKDLDAPPLPDGRNAALFLRRAAQAFIPNRFPPMVVGPPAGSVWEEVFNARRRAQVVAANGPALADVRNARGLSGVDWGLQHRRPIYSMLLPHVQQQFHVAGLVATAVEEAADRGNAEATQAYLLDLLRMAEAVQGNFVSQHTFSLQVTGMALDEVPRLMPLVLANARRESGAATAERKRIADLIRLLLDDGPQRRGLIRATRGERVARNDTLQALGDGSWLLRPTFDAAAVRGLPWDAAVDRAAEDFNSRAVAELVSLQYQPSGLIKFGPIVSMPPNWVVGGFRTAADRRLAAVALAVAVYQADHAGRLPATLEALVPAYLPNVPLDPFDPDGGPLRYAPAYRPTPDAPPSPRVYSVGDDGQDDGGTGDPDKRWWGKQSPDAVFTLALEPGAG